MKTVSGVPAVLSNLFTGGSPSGFNFIVSQCECRDLWKKNQLLKMIKCELIRMSDVSRGKVNAVMLSRWRQKVCLGVFCLFFELTLIDV